MISKSQCETCGSRDLYSIYALQRIPAFQNKLFSSAEAARQAVAAQVDLAACPACGFVFNALFDNSVMDYDGDYQNAQDHSPSFQSYLSDIASLILTRLAPKSKVVEIGCGKGYFLSVLKAHGVDVTGFDPAYEGNDPGIVKAYFDADTASGIEAQAVIMRHTLEHIERPHAFLMGLKKILKPDTRIFIEVPRFEWIVQHKAFWDVFHEHCNYFSEDFFQGIFSGKIEIIKTFDDQYMLVAARIGDLLETPRPLPHPKYTDLLSSEILKCERLVAAGRRHYIWGAGAKGIAFVNILDPQGIRIASLIDINPKKQGHFVPLTGHACVAPASVDWARLREDDCLWIMNAHYKNEILGSLPPLGCKVVVLGED